MLTKDGFCPAGQRADAKWIDLLGLADHLCGLPSEGRVICALAGPPASGKSHSAQALAGAVAKRGREVAVVQMDGFHFDDAILKSRDQLARKGAPQTFDIGGFEILLSRVKSNRDTDIYAPTFDRRLEVSRGSAVLIGAQTEVVIVEGNYLLLDDPDWAPLETCFDISVMVVANRDTLRHRLLDRWASEGLPEGARLAKVDGNDMPNAELVLSGSRDPDYWLSTDPEDLSVMTR